MFKDNSLKGVKQYFVDKLEAEYSEREINTFFEWTCQDKFSLDRSTILLNERRFSESELLTFRAVVKQLQNNIPIQYILGKAHFHDLEFVVGQGVLCPRPETEELADLIIQNHTEGSLLDIGTGSGAIPLTVKHKRPQIAVTGLEKSPKALEFAKENSKRLKLEASWIEMDILTQYPNKSYDIVVSNPPYVLESDKSDMDATVLDHEPHEALFVPDNEPLKFYERIAVICDFILKPEGTLYFEIHERFGHQIKEMLQHYNFTDITLIKDLQGKDRMVKTKKAPLK